MAFRTQQLIFGALFAFSALAAPSSDSAERYEEQQVRVARVIHRLTLQAPTARFNAASQRLREEEAFLARLRGNGIMPDEPCPRADRALRFALLRSGMALSSDPELRRAAFASWARDRRTRIDPIDVPAELLAAGYPGLDGAMYRPERMALRDLWRQNDRRAENLLTRLLADRLESSEELALRALLQSIRRGPVSATVDRAVSAMCEGAYDGMAEPFSIAADGNFHDPSELPLAAMMALSDDLTAALEGEYQRLNLDVYSDVPLLPSRPLESSEARFERWRIARARAVATIARQVAKHPRNPLGLATLRSLASNFRHSGPDLDLFGDYSLHSQSARRERLLFAEALPAMMELTNGKFALEIRVAATAFLMRAGTLADDAYEPLWRRLARDNDPEMRAQARSAVVLGRIRLPLPDGSLLRYEVGFIGKTPQNFRYAGPNASPPQRSRRMTALATELGEEGIGGVDEWMVAPALNLWRTAVIDHQNSADPAIRAWAASLHYDGRTPQGWELPALLERVTHETAAEPRQVFLEAINRFLADANASHATLASADENGDRLRRWLVVRALKANDPESAVSLIPNIATLWLPLLAGDRPEDLSVRVLAASVIRGRCGFNEKAKTAVQSAYVRGRLREDWEHIFPTIRWGSLEKMQTHPDAERRRIAFTLAIDAALAVVEENPEPFRAMMLRYADEMDWSVRGHVKSILRRRLAEWAAHRFVLNELFEDAPEGRYRDTLAELMLTLDPQDLEVQAAARSALHGSANWSAVAERNPCAVTVALDEQTHADPPATPSGN